MKNIYTLFLCLAFFFEGYSQAVVVDTQANISLNQLNILTEQIATLQSEASAASVKAEAIQSSADEASKSYGFIENLKTAKKLLNMLENMVCASRNMQVAMSFGHHSCLIDFKYEMVLAKLSLSADLVSVILTAYRMSVGDRMKSLNDALQRFEEAQEMMNSLTKFIGKLEHENAILEDLYSVKMYNYKKRIK